VPDIFDRISEEKLDITIRAIYKLVKKYQYTGSVNDLSRHKRQRILTEEMRQFINNKLMKNDKLNSTKLKDMLTERWTDPVVSTTTIKRERRNLGWVCTRPHYCQLLREAYFAYLKLLLLYCVL